MGRREPSETLVCAVVVLVDGTSIFTEVRCGVSAADAASDAAFGMWDDEAIEAAEAGVSTGTTMAMVTRGNERVCGEMAAVSRSEGSFVCKRARELCAG